MKHTSYWLPISVNKAKELHGNFKRFEEHPCFLQVKKDNTPYKACIIATGLHDIPSHGIIVKS